MRVIRLCMVYPPRRTAITRRIFPMRSVAR